MNFRSSCEFVDGKIQLVAAWVVLRSISSTTSSVCPYVRHDWLIGKYLLSGLGGSKHPCCNDLSRNSGSCVARMDVFADIGHVVLDRRVDRDSRPDVDRVRIEDSWPKELAYRWLAERLGSQFLRATCDQESTESLSGDCCQIRKNTLNTCPSCERRNII